MPPESGGGMEIVMSEEQRSPFREALLKEWKAAFAAPAAYVYGAILLLVVGIFTLRYNVTGQLSNFEYAIDAAKQAKRP